MADYEWLKPIREMVGREYGRIIAWDEVNPAMVRQWCEVMGVENPLYTDAEYAHQSEFGELVAPPSMLQSWCEAGFYRDSYAPGSTEDNPYTVLKLIEAEGYPSVVAVNSELTFERYVKMGEKLYYTTRFDAISEEKVTALGTGFFVTLIMSYFSINDSGEDDKVGELLFRVFKFKPANPVARPEKTESGLPKIKRPKPGISDDTRFFWEGCEQGELRIQHCKACDKLQHPPAPVCMYCHSFELDYQLASGKGQLYSFVVMHYPEVPPFDHPNPIGLIELEEGVRLSAQLIDVDKDQLQIGMALEVRFETFDDEMTLPLFAPVSAAAESLT
ncbi:OB-fold domain-containing protein [Shewanella corallii]|uniref:OB-fold domain-containing protein n=1 Tax=Shewanella corallii TaxID=560080 RepID=A0ABT0N696_9GAMM|nr:OB-fold domain-containing protein [Shewanella corallii]MCL2913949.1 OB-fold domain-containing protein [Shewanella corallii]